MKQAGFWFQLVGLIVTMGGLGYTWVQWVRSDPDHPFRTRTRNVAARVRTWLGRPRTHQVSSSVSTTWNVAVTAEGRAFAPEEGLAGRVQALEHRVEDLETATSRRLAETQKSVDRLREDFTKVSDELRTSLKVQETAHLKRTRSVAVGGLGIAAVGVLLSTIGTVISYVAT